MSKKLLVFVVNILFVQLITAQSLEIATEKLENIYSKFDTQTDIETKQVEVILSEILPIFKEYKAWDKVISVIGWQGYLTFEQTQNSRSLKPFVEKIEAHFEQLINQESSYLDIGYWCLGRWYHRRELPKTKQYAQKIISISKTDRMSVLGKLMLTKMLLFESHYEEVLTELDDLEVFIDGTNNKILQPYKVEICRQRITNYSYLHEAEKAELYAEQLLVLNEKYNYFKSGSLPILYKEISQAYIANKNGKQAIKWAQKALEAAEQSFGANHINTAPYINNLGELYSNSLTKATEAVELFKRSLSILQVNPRMKAYESLVMNNIAYCYHKLMMLDSAMVWTDRGIEVAEAHPIEQFKIRLYSRKVLLYYELGDYQNGIPFIKSSLEKLYPDLIGKSIDKNLSLKLINKWHRTFESWIEVYVSLLEQKATAEQDEASFEEALKITGVLLKFSKEEDKALRYSERSLELYQTTKQNTYGIIANIYYEKYQLTKEEEDRKAFFKFIEEEKAKGFLTTLRDEEEILGTQMLQKKINYLQEIADLETKLLVKDAIKDSVTHYKNIYFETKTAYNTFQKNIYSQYPQYEVINYNPNVTSITQVQDNMDHQTAFIQYYIALNKLYIHVITKEGQYIITAKEGVTLRDMVKRYYELVQSPLLVQDKYKKEFIQLSNYFYQLLIEPIYEQIASKERLIILPDNYLFYVPFESLLKQDDVKPFEQLDFLIKQFDISYHYSITTYQKFRQIPSIQDNSLLAFAPIFTKKNNTVNNESTTQRMVENNYRAFDDGVFTGLPGTEREVKNIRRLLKKNESAVQHSFTFQDATEQNLKYALANNAYQFAHIATHSVADVTEPKFSVIVCSQDTKTPNEDNMFYAFEIQHHKMKIDLAILSSCESAKGQLLYGKGLKSLNRSFLYAGAKNVLSSLWAINDEHSSSLMINFYKAYLEQNSYTKALRSAKLQMLANPKTAAPRYWAPFVLMGE